MIFPQVYPMRVKMDDQSVVVPEFPEQCEWQCLHSDGVRLELGYVGFSEWLDRKYRTRDERQCRGCGRWGIFEYRAILPPKHPTVEVIYGPVTEMWMAPAGAAVTGEGWRRII